MSNLHLKNAEDTASCILCVNTFLLLESLFPLIGLDCP